MIYGMGLERAGALSLDNEGKVAEAVAECQTEMNFRVMWRVPISGRFLECLTYP